MTNIAVKIAISGLPTIYPDHAYIDKMYTILRVIRIGYHSEIFVTDDQWQTIVDQNFRERTVQTIAYDKYKIRIQANEYVNAELIKFAKRVFITTQDDIVHQAHVLNVTYNIEDTTELGTYEIEYFDINQDNYQDLKFPVNEFLESDQIQTEYEQAQLVQLTLSHATAAGTISIDAEWDDNGYNGMTLYSELLPKYEVTEVEEQKSEVGAVEVVSRSFSFRTLNARFFLKTSDKNIVQKYISRCNQVSIKTPAGTFLALERITPEVKEVANDLFQIDVALKYEELDFYPQNF